MMNTKDLSEQEYAKLRIQVMMNIHHPEAYYQNAIKSKGVDYQSLTHSEIAVWVATIKMVEADALIAVGLDSAIESFKSAVLTLEEKLTEAARITNERAETRAKNRAKYDEQTL